MTTAATPAALSAYRTLLRSIKLTFANDARMLTAAMTESRDIFRSRSHVSGAEQDEHLKHAREIADVLRTNVVQGERISESEEAYKLRIHDATEKGDNESIKKAQQSLGKTPGSPGPGKCCSA